MNDTRTIEILLVEDNPGDVELTREAFINGEIANRINVARDGVEALEYLRRQGVYSNAVRPDIVLLDLNLPRKSGLEVLVELKADPELRSIPIVVLTTSRDEQDIAHSYHAYANCYISKPVDFDEFMGVARSLESFWLTVVRLPTKSV